MSMPVDPENRKFEPAPKLSEIDLADTTAILSARDASIRESWVSVMELHIIREQLSKCYQREGVNHHANCKNLVEAYMKRLAKGGIRNWRELDTEKKN
ncbi:hypothetical protein BKA69DRAFT_1058958 [Paraphysoderma sedebokerense]|nr:hypothetical protein BKA69DRAFT_1058958 [Paraphysoderma sedebokerense]